MEITKEQTIGEIVAADYRRAAVFSKYKIDFCCKGNRNLEKVCEKAQLDADKLIQELTEVDKNTPNSAGIAYQDLPLDLLIDFIEKKFHRKLREQTPIINAYLTKLCKVHGEAHPELHEIRSLFFESSEDLAAHLLKEENILFPFVRQLFAQGKINAPFGNVQNPIRVMQEEHELEGDRFRKISELSQNYTPPADACNTYKAAFALLKEFEADLHLHIHLENNILFPQAIALNP